MRNILFLAPFALIVGCQSTQIAATPRSVIYTGVDYSTIQDTTTKALMYCNQFNRDAELVPDDVADGRATFRCTDR